MSGRGESLVCEVAGRACTFPLEAVIETMRPLPIDAIAGSPTFVSGLAIIRGEAVPVVDTARLIGATTAKPTRFVTLRVGARRVAFAVDAVVGVRSVDESKVGQLPPLLGEVGGDLVTSIGALDQQLLVVLEAARVMTPDVWKALDAAAAAR